MKVRRASTDWANGGVGGNRTLDQRIKSPMLYRLSYHPDGCRGPGPRGGAHDTTRASGRGRVRHAGGGEAGLADAAGVAAAAGAAFRVRLDSKQDTVAREIDTRGACPRG